jgi:hypothetical protein
MKKFMLTVVFMLSVIGLAHAKTYQFGSPAVLQVNLPDRWKSNEIDNGVQSTSPDEGMYLAFESFAVKDLDNTVKEATNFFFEQGLTLDPASQSHKMYGINQIGANQVSWSAKTKDGSPAKVGLTVFAASGAATGVIMTYWGGATASAENSKDLNEIVNSLKKM